MRSTRIGRLVGSYAYRRGKGQIWLEMLRAWILPALGGSAALKYLGVQGRWAIVAMVGIALTCEALALLIGWLEHRSGATEQHYREAAETDVFKRESLRLQAECLTETRRLREILAKRYGEP